MSRDIRLRESAARRVFFAAAAAAGERGGGGVGVLPSKFVLENFMKIHLIIFMKFCFFFRKVAPQRAVVSRRIQ